MSHGYAGDGARHEPVHYVQVARADAGECDADNGVAVIDGVRTRFFEQAEIFLSDIGVSEHIVLRGQYIPKRRSPQEENGGI